MTPIGAELERLLAPAIAAAGVELETLAKEAGGCRTSFGTVVTRLPSGELTVRHYATAGGIADPGEVVMYSDIPGITFAGVIQRVREKAALHRETAARLDELRREAGELGYELVKQED